jgi:hypothetical protein
VGLWGRQGQPDLRDLPDLKDRPDQQGQQVDLRVRQGLRVQLEPPALQDRVDQRVLEPQEQPDQLDLPDPPDHLARQDSERQVLRVRLVQQVPQVQPDQGRAGVESELPDQQAQRVQVALRVQRDQPDLRDRQGQDRDLRAH